MTMPYLGSTEPYQQDTKLVLLFKILGAINNFNGGAVSEPNYFPEGSTPLMQDTEWKLLQKICGALNEIATAGGAPPSGPAGGDLKGTYPDPLIQSIHMENGADLVSVLGKTYFYDHADGFYYRYYVDSSLTGGTPQWIMDDTNPKTYAQLFP